MREFTSPIVKALENGLYPEVRVRRNDDFLAISYNGKPSQMGLLSHEKITDPFVGTKTITYPFPQLIRGRGETFLCYENSIEKVNETTYPWTSVVQEVHDYKTGDVSAITGSGHWHLIDFRDAWFLLNGTSTVMFPKSRLFTGLPGTILVQDDIPISSGCQVRGRAVVGGFDPNNFWRDEWKALFDYWKSLLAAPIAPSHDEVGSNFVMWSSIGASDFPLWLFFPEHAIEGSVIDGEDYGYSIESPILFDMMKRNEFGFMPMPYQGKVLVTKPLGDGFVAYGEDGFAYLRPYANEVAAGYGIHYYDTVSVYGRGAVGGDDNQHVFVDNAGVVWTFTADSKLNRLGYTDHIGSLIGGDILVTYNSGRGEYYISDGSRSFVLNKSGLGEIGQHPTSIYYTSGAVLGMVDDGDQAFQLVTAPFDLGNRAIKTITGIEVGISGDTDAYVYIDYRYNKKDDFTRSKGVWINPQGITTIRVSGIDFRVVVDADDYIEVEVDYINVKWQQSDERTIRGPYANQIAT